RLMKQCETFLLQRQMIAEGSPFFCTTPHPQAAVYLVAWIMHSCDSMNLDGSPINTNVEQSTYTHAQKMRAAATFGFGRIHSLGMQAWHQSEISGQMLGNPCYDHASSGMTPASLLSSRNPSPKLSLLRCFVSSHRIFASSHLRIIRSSYPLSII
ncbi:hypothetical protein F5890DRAFT_1421601, partial [Lentinula detonsa]